MSKLIGLLSSSAVVATFLVAGLGSVTAAAAGCTPTGFVRDGINLTAAQIGGDVTGSLDATGCNIGVYYDNNSAPGNVSGADIFGANYYGVVVNGDVGTVSVDVTGSTVHNIGETPLNGDQHGNAIYYRAFGGSANGTISDNTVTQYQKNGITINGNVSATIANNTVKAKALSTTSHRTGSKSATSAQVSVTENTRDRKRLQRPQQGQLGRDPRLRRPLPSAALASISLHGRHQDHQEYADEQRRWRLSLQRDANCVAPASRTNNVCQVQHDHQRCCYQHHRPESHVRVPGGYFRRWYERSHRQQLDQRGGLHPTAGGDCTGTTPAFLRLIDADPSARGVSSNK